MDRYIHQPIPKDADEIRLIKFIDSNNINIFHEHLSNQPKYRALSYFWGKEKCDRPLQVVISPEHCPEVRTLEITKNCKGALERLFQDNSSIPVWIDAICINQNDLHERNHQVGLMSKIYHCAEKVQIDLGEGDEGTQRALMYLEQEYGFMDSSGSPLKFFPYTEHAPMEVQKVLSDILARSWFKRLWVLQEVHFAKYAEVLCGRDKITWRVLRLIGSHIYTNTNSKVNQAHGGHLPNEGAKQIATKIPPILTISEGGLTAKTLAEWMEETSSLECTDPRDTVYALLGLASDIQNAELHILPDYTKTLFEIHPLVAKQYALHALKGACVANGLAVKIDQNGSIEKMFSLALEAAVAKGLKSFVVSETQKHLIRRILALVNLPNPVLAWYLNFCTKEFANEIPMPRKKGSGLWDIIRAARLLVLERSRASLSAVAFSVDGKHVAFALQDKTVKVLDVASGALL